MDHDTKRISPLPLTTKEPRVWIEVFRDWLTQILMLVAVGLPRGRPGALLSRLGELADLQDQCGGADIFDERLVWTWALTLERDSDARGAAIHAGAAALAMRLFRSYSGGLYMSGRSAEELVSTLRFRVQDARDEASARRSAGGAAPTSAPPSSRRILGPRAPAETDEAGLARKMLDLTPIVGNGRTGHEEADLRASLIRSLPRDEPWTVTARDVSLFVDLVARAVR